MRLLNQINKLEQQLIHIISTTTMNPWYLINIIICKNESKLLIRVYRFKWLFSIEHITRFHIVHTQHYKRTIKSISTVEWSRTPFLFHATDACAHWKFSYSFIFRAHFLSLQQQNVSLINGLENSRLNWHALSFIMHIERFIFKMPVSLFFCFASTYFHFIL